MKQKLSIFVLLTLAASLFAADETNTPAPTNRVEAGRARIQHWRAEFRGSHSTATNSTSTNALDETDKLSVEERRARVRAQLNEWRENQIPSNSFGAVTNTAVKNPAVH